MPFYSLISERYQAVMTMGIASHRTDVPLGEPGTKNAGRWLRALVALGALGSAALISGFFVFVAALDRVEPRSLPKTDGIVALTGGPDRIPDAVSWLAKGLGDRLLISGVSQNISVDQLAQKAPRLKSWINCCIDLDHQARNTVGNAEETRRWAEMRGYRSLMIVTSSYHMPRAMVELKRHMPQVELVAAPVVTARLQGLAYWRDLPLLKTLGHEYGKFLVAYLRARLTSPASSDDMAQSSSKRRV
jgi:uncharacterized SAM-binding protein YcdF (DUF218 family)